MLIRPLFASCLARPLSSNDNVILFRHPRHYAAMPLLPKNQNVKRHLHRHITSNSLLFSVLVTTDVSLFHCRALLLYLSQDSIWLSSFSATLNHLYQKHIPVSTFIFLVLLFPIQLLGFYLCRHFFVLRISHYCFSRIISFCRPFFA